jgi:hypothetical protein
LSAGRGAHRMTLETFIVIGIILAMVPVALADFTDDKK